MNKKKISIVIVSSIVAIFALTLGIRTAISFGVDNTELRTKYNCDRLTREALSTDKYCSDLALYRRDYILFRAP